MGDSTRRGYAHAYPIEKLLEFRRVSPEVKLRWLQEMRIFVDRFTTPERKRLMERIRNGEI